MSQCVEIVLTHPCFPGILSSLTFVPYKTVLFLMTKCKVILGILFSTNRLREKVFKCPHKVGFFLCILTFKLANNIMDLTVSYIRAVVLPSFLKFQFSLNLSIVNGPWVSIHTEHIPHSPLPSPFSLIFLSSSWSPQTFSFLLSYHIFDNIHDIYYINI